MIIYIPLHAFIFNLLVTLEQKTKTFKHISFDSNSGEINFFAHFSIFLH